MTYEARRRGPLVDSHSRTIIERRAMEILGVAALLGCIALAGILGSYSATDPGLFTANDYPVKNLFGLTGASIASPLMLILGLSAWGFVAFVAVWAMRCMFHAGEGRFFSRLIFLPFLIMALSILLATMTPHSGWPHNFGIGGMFGETALGVLVYVWPTGVVQGELYSAYGSAGAVILLAYLAFGMTVGELAALSTLFAKLRTAGRAVRKKARPETKPAAGKRSSSSSTGKSGSRISLHRFLPSRTWFAQGRSSKAGAAGISIRRQDPPVSAPDEHGETVPDLQMGGDEPSGAGKGQGLLPSILARTRGEPVSVTGSDNTSIAKGVAEPRIAPVGRTSDAGTDLGLDTGTDRVDSAPKKKKSNAASARGAKRSASADSAVQAYEAPSISLLQPPVHSHQTVGSDVLRENAAHLTEVLGDYGVNGTIDAVRPGPVVTQYELLPEPGLKASRVIGLSDDIARNMSAVSARISTVPGKRIIGIELPNDHRETVYLREVMSDPQFTGSDYALPIALGKTIGGEPVVVDLASMPHLLIAGTTGSGKSVAINTMILSLLYKQSPEDCRMIMIDPKMLELSVYDGIPHLMSPVVTDPKQAVYVLKWVVAEMGSRYRKMSKMGVRKLSTYNERMREAKAKGQRFTRTVQTGFDEVTGEPVYVEEFSDPEVLPYIVVVVDEMADLMMAAGKEIEACVQRLAQMARASGIHVVLATQRPSVDVITGTIKANIPTRASFQVASKIDSRTILGEQGAEQLLGRGDMLLMTGGSRITRIHGPFVDDTEVEFVVNHLKTQGPPEYVPEIVEGPDENREHNINKVLGLGGNSSSDDKQYDMAVEIIRKDRKCSTSYIQRKLGIGYNKAARLVERMEEEGLVSAPNHVGKREILVPE